MGKCRTYSRPNSIGIADLRRHSAQLDVQTQRRAGGTHHSLVSNLCVQTVSRLLPSFLAVARMGWLPTGTGQPCTLTT